MHIQNLFTLLYLLLVRHYNVMRLCHEHILHYDELVDANMSVHMVRHVYRMRRQSVCCECMVS